MKKVLTGQSPEEDWQPCYISVDGFKICLLLEESCLHFGVKSNLLARANAGILNERPDAHFSRSVGKGMCLKLTLQGTARECYCFHLGQQ